MLPHFLTDLGWLSLKVHQGSSSKRCLSLSAWPLPVTDPPESLAVSTVPGCHHGRQALGLSRFGFKAAAYPSWPLGPWVIPPPRKASLSSSVILQQSLRPLALFWGEMEGYRQRGQTFCLIQGWLCLIMVIVTQWQLVFSCDQVSLLSRQMSHKGYVRESQIQFCNWVN